MGYLASKVAQLLKFARQLKWYMCIGLLCVLFAWCFRLSGLEQLSVALAFESVCSRWSPNRMSVPRLLVKSWCCPYSAEADSLAGGWLTDGV